MKILFCLVVVLNTMGCSSERVTFRNEELTELLNATINIEIDSSDGRIMKAKSGEHFLVNQTFQSVTDLDSMILWNYVTKNTLQNVSEAYQKQVKIGNNVPMDSFHTIQLQEFSTNTPKHSRFARPFRANGYYFVGFKYISSSEYYKSLLVFKRDPGEKLRLITRYLNPEA